jgi:hypothetical protein
VDDWIFAPHDGLMPPPTPAQLHQVAVLLTGQPRLSLFLGGRLTHSASTASALWTSSLARSSSFLSRFISSRLSRTCTPHTGSPSPLSRHPLSGALHNASTASMADIMTTSKQGQVCSKEADPSNQVRWQHGASLLTLFGEVNGLRLYRRRLLRVG